MQAQSGVRREILRFACVLGTFAAPVISYGNPTGQEGRAQKPSATFLGENVAWEKATDS